MSEWKLVPVEPTGEQWSRMKSAVRMMLHKCAEAKGDEYDALLDCFGREVYDAALAAATAAPAQEPVAEFAGHGPNQKCPRCGFHTLNVFQCPVCKMGGRDGMMKAWDDRSSTVLDERAWLIESKFNGPPSWWAGGAISDEGVFAGSGFTTDPNEAVRFARKEDAERVANGRHMVFVTEHIWIARSALAGRRNG